MKEILAKNFLRVRNKVIYTACAVIYNLFEIVNLRNPKVIGEI